MILDTLLDDIEGFDIILRDLNSEHFSYLRRAGIERISASEVKQGLKRLFLAGYVKALEQTMDGLERRDPKDVDIDALENYWFELTEKGREVALRYEW